MVFVLILAILTFLLDSVFLVQGNLEVNFSDKEMALFDFTQNDSAEGWIEQSDTVREVGMSKAILTIQKTQLFSRAILFTLLNPQPNGAGFAGVQKFTALNLENYNYLTIRFRAQGENYHYKVVLRHKDKNDEPNPTYEQFFKISPNKFQTISLPFSDFKPYYRGKELNNTEPLDKSSITSIGLQIYGGVYSPIKQSGASSLEIDWIKAME